MDTVDIYYWQFAHLSAFRCIADHVAQGNHTICWDKAKMVESRALRGLTFADCTHPSPTKCCPHPTPAHITLADSAHAHTAPTIF